MAAFDRYIFTSCWPARALRSSSIAKEETVSAYLIWNWNGTWQDGPCRWRDEPGKGILQIPFNVRSLTLQWQFRIPKFCFMPYIYSPFMERRLGTVLTILGVLSWMGGTLREPHLRTYTRNALSVLDIHNFFLAKFSLWNWLSHKFACFSLLFFFFKPATLLYFWCPF